MPPQTASFPPPDHDHRRCASHAMAAAEAVCNSRGSRLTALRQKVLEAIWQSHTPIGAYDILARINRGGGRNAPMAVYRALDFLIEQGLVHRLASRNAFIGCRHPGNDHTAQFLICTDCDSVAELDSSAVSASIKRAASAKGFSVSGETVEVAGRCPNCRPA